MSVILELKSVLVTILVGFLEKEESDQSLDIIELLDPASSPS